MKRWLTKTTLLAAIAFPAVSAVAWAGTDDFGCSNATLKGAYAFSVLTIVAAAPVGPGVVVGLGTFDGRGGFTQIDYPGNGGTDLGLDEKFRTGQTGSMKLPRFRRVVLDLGDYGSVVTASIAAS